MVIYRLLNTQLFAHINSRCVTQRSGIITYWLKDPARDLGPPANGVRRAASETNRTRRDPASESAAFMGLQPSLCRCKAMGAGREGFDEAPVCFCE